MLPSITRFVLGDFQTNCYIVQDPGQDACWIVDCGQNPDELLDYISTEGLQPVAILLTHAHADHIWGIDQALSRLGDLPIFLHEAEQDWCGNPMLNLSELFGFPISVTGPTDLLKHDDTLKLAKRSAKDLIGSDSNRGHRHLLFRDAVIDLILRAPGARVM